MSSVKINKVDTRMFTESLNLASVAAEAGNGVFTAATTDIVTDATHGLATGAAVRLTNAGGALPAGLAVATTYFVFVIDANTFYLYLGRNDALVGGTPGRVDITGTGTGVHTWHEATEAAQDLAVDGLSGTIEFVGPPALTTGLEFVVATVPSPDTCKMTFRNFTGSAINETAATWYILATAS